MDVIRIQANPLAGFAARSAAEGEDVEVLQRGMYLASDPRFYLFINQIETEFLAPAGINGDGITKFLALMHPDYSTDVYTNIGLVVEAVVKRAVEAGSPVYVEDVGSIAACRIEDISIQPDDAVVCVIKMGWKYGLLFDYSRDTSEDKVWQQLGQLCNSLHTDRIIENIQRQILEAEKPHIITEGKTDWRHIEAARRVLEPQLVLSYPTSDGSLGDSGLLQLCERMAKFGPSNKNKVIAVFDRDNPQVLKKLGQQGDVNSYQPWGNNVYSFALPTPGHRLQYKHISIEMLYTEQDLARTDENGKRLFFDKELEIRKTPSGDTYCVPVALDGALEYDKKVADDLASRIVDNDGKQLGLSKARFADLVYGEVRDFSALDFVGFAGVFEVIKKILAAPTLPESELVG